MKNDAKILILGGRGSSTNIVFNRLNTKFTNVFVIRESSESKFAFFKRRLKRVGYLEVLGQILFMVFVIPYLNYSSKARISEIRSQNEMDNSDIPSNQMLEITSINHKEALAKILQINPEIIIVNGTRIIGKRLLSSISCKCINIHAGITPQYRGVHGGYWALANNDFVNCGVTVHYVDTGIDTGTVIAQSRIKPSIKDNFVTYPSIQLALGIKLLETVIEYELAGVLLNPIENKIRGTLWYHPTIWTYIRNRLIRNIK